MSYAQLGRILIRQGGDTPQPDNAPQQHTSGGIPEINGSSAGFIALVAALAAIILISCIGVFILLREHKADPFEQHARRIMTGPRELNVHEMPLGPPGLKEKVRKLFGWRKRRDGWVRASSGEEDEWDASDHHLMYGHGHAQSRSLDDTGIRWINDSHKTLPTPSTIERNETPDSVQLSVPDAGRTRSRSPSDPPFRNPFASSPTAMVPSELPPESSSSHPTERDDKRFSVQSGFSQDGTPSIRSMRKFESGTKFREALEF